MPLPRADTWLFSGSQPPLPSSTPGWAFGLRWLKSPIPPGLASQSAPISQWGWPHTTDGPEDYSERYTELSGVTRALSPRWTGPGLGAR